ncbi:Tumor necrosis factor receptor superfamily member 10B [Lemmus lemmus]
MTLKLQAVVFLLLSTFGRVLAETVRDHPADLQNVQQNPSGSPCSPGFHLSDENRCVPCMDGIEYTSEPNDLPSCRKCSTCTTGEDEIRRCNSTQDTECQCKPGTFKDENSPEFCQKCSECTNEESEKTSCTPNTNRKCVPKDSQHDLGLIIGISVPVLLIFLSSIAVVVFFRKHVLQFMKRACPGREQHSENAVPLMEVRTSNPENDSPAMKAPEEPKEASDSPTEAELLLLANGIGPVDGQPPAADGPHRQ